MSFDSVEDNASFVKNQSFNFPLLCDTERKMGLAYGATQPGSTGDAKRMGVIIDPQGNVSHYWPAVKARDFPQQALEALG